MYYFIIACAFLLILFSIVLFIISIKETLEFMKVKNSNSVDGMYGLVKSYNIDSYMSPSEVRGVSYKVSCTINGVSYKEFEAYRLSKKYFIFYPTKCGDIVNMNVPIKYFFKHNNQIKLCIFEESKVRNQLIRNYLIAGGSFILSIVIFVVSSLLNFM